MSALPPGLTPEMMANLAAFLAAQPAKQNVSRPNGLLQPNQIRGYNANYKYEFREYPKALTPPRMTVRDANHERTLRVEWGRPLPWNNDLDGAPRIAEYYGTESYPKEIVPPQIVVFTRAEEDAKLAAWRAEAGDEPLNRDADYPKWLFHPDKPALMVATRDEEIALGRGWFSTPAEAQSASKPKGPSTAKYVSNRMTPEEEAERIDLVERAAKVNLQFYPQWSSARLKREVEELEAKLQPA